MRQLVFAVLAVLVAVALIPAAGRPALSGNDGRKVLHDAATGDLKPEKLPVEETRDGTKIATTKPLPFISGAPIAAAQAALGVAAARERLEGADAISGADIPIADLGAAAASLGCSKRTSNDNVRVNQDCSFRRQAEESITFNPVEPKNLVAAQNDSRAGFNQCGIDFSTDNGQHWGDMLPPFRQKVNNPAGQAPTGSDPNRHTIVGGSGTFHTYDAASDPTVAFDSQGRAFFSCLTFDVFTDASALLVTASPPGAHGSFFFNVPTFSRRFVVVEDNSPAAFHDKQFIRADVFGGSPNRDNVYVTWTVFNFTCGASGGGYCSSPIFGSMSTNHGLTWSTPEEISGRNASLCQFGGLFTGNAADNNKCNFDQGSDPIVLPNGDLVVAFFNGNTPTVDNQQLGVRCHPTGKSESGTAHLNCGTPVRIGTSVEAGAPLCDFGRGPEECIPGAFIRTNTFPRIAVHPGNGHLYVAWQDYRNGEWDIQLTRSLDGGATWASSVTANPDSGLDHYFAAIDLAKASGEDRVGLSYFRTERVPNENTTPADGFTPGRDPGVQARNSDYVLAGGRNLRAPFDFKVLSPAFPPPDGIQAGFNGDYSGLTINRGDEAHPIWSDTRNADPFAPANGVTHDEDIFTTKVELPEEEGRPTTGVIGKH